MSSNLHVICVKCWNRIRSDAQINEAEYSKGEPDPCCFCGVETRSSIPFKADPATTRCKGVTGIHAERIDPSPPLILDPDDSDGEGNPGL